MPVDYHAWTHAPKAQGGTDPIEGLKLPFAYMNWTDGGDVPTGAKMNPADLTGGTPYVDGFISAAGLAMTPAPFVLDFEAGIITFASDGLYLAQFTAQWADTWAAGTRVYTSVLYQGDGPGPVGNFDVREPITNDTDETNNTANGLFVSNDADQGFPFNIAGIVMQESGSDKFLTGATLQIVRLETYSLTDGVFFTLS